MGYPHVVIFKVKLAIIQTRVFLHLKGTYIHVFLYNICRIYMSCHILLEGFALFYHIPHTRGMHMSLEIYKK